MVRNICSRPAGMMVNITVPAVDGILERLVDAVDALRDEIARRLPTTHANS
jgi:hypothetical protein